MFKSTRRRRALDRATAANAKGLPAKPYGRIALAVAPSKPKIVYAMIESKESALYPLGRRRREAGRKLDASQMMVWRPFYFANLIVDPKDENKVFKPDRLAAAERERRQEFQRSPRAHGDFHDVWIDPANSNTVYHRRRRGLVA